MKQGTYQGADLAKSPSVSSPPPLLNERIHTTKTSIIKKQFAAVVTAGLLPTSAALAVSYDFLTVTNTGLLTSQFTSRTETCHQREPRLFGGRAGGSNNLNTLIFLPSHNSVSGHRPGGGPSRANGL